MDLLVYTVHHLHNKSSFSHLDRGELSPPNNAKNPHGCEVSQCDLTMLDGDGFRHTQKTSYLLSGPNVDRIGERC